MREDSRKRPGDQETEHHGDGEHQQMVGDRVPVHRRDLSQPRARPQALNPQESALVDHPQRGDAPEHPPPQDVADAHGGREETGRLALTGRSRVARDQQEQDHRAQEQRDREQEEQLAPGHHPEHPRGGSGGRQRSDGPYRHHEPVQEREARRWGPEHECLERGHQACRHPKTREEAPQKQKRERVRDSEQEATHGGDQQQRSVGPPWSQMVQRAADRQLGQGESEQVGASQQADPERGQPEIPHQVRSDDRGDRAKQPRDEVPEGEGNEDANPEPDPRAGSSG